MKYWCYYTDVVRYLEKLEALYAPKTKAPAYLVWQDDDGPSMIVGPGVEWYRGDGPPPHLDAITVSLINRAVNRTLDGAATVRERSARTPLNPKKTRKISVERSCTETRPNRKKTSGVSTEQSRVEAPPNRTTQNQAAPPARSKQSNQSKVPRMWHKRAVSACRHSRWHQRNPDPAHKPTAAPIRRANKRRTNFPKPAQTCSLFP